MSKLYKVDFLFFGYLLITTILILAGGNSVINPQRLFLVRGFILAAVFGLIYLENQLKNRFIFLIRNTYSIILSGYFYSETVFFNKLFFNNLDPILEQIDRTIFGSQPSILFSEILPNYLFSELMYFAYFSFYLLIISFVITAFFKSETIFTKAIFQLSASLYLFYIIFALLPSAGPQFYFSFPDNALPESYVFDKIMHLIQALAEQPTGAFPSSHVGIALIILTISKKILPVFFKIALPIVFLLILSTVYIKAHYVTDIIGGFIFAPFILWIANFLFKSIPEKTFNFTKS